MQRYFSVKTQGFYHEGVQKDIPEDVIKISSKEYDEIYLKLSSGYSVLVVDKEFVFTKTEDTHTELKERLWRNTELSKVDVQLNKVQDSDPKAIGTVSQWREYRKALRAWPENKDFPNKDKRPISPDA